MDDLVNKLSAENPGFDALVLQTTALVLTSPPSFIYINDPATPRISSSVITAVLSRISNLSTEPLEPNHRIHCTSVNAVACFTPRLLYDSILNGLANWQANWADGCENWAPSDESPAWNENLNSFVHGLKALHAELASSTGRKGKSKGKAPAHTVRLVIMIERAERLKESMPDLIGPLTRLAELSRVDLSLIFHSDVSWEDIRPSLGASPEPYYIDVHAIHKQGTVQRLVSLFDAASNAASGSRNYTYHPALRPLYEHFASIIYSTCGTFTQDPDDLAYISAARWPGFVQPLLDEQLGAFHEANEGPDNSEVPDLVLPSEIVRMRLTRLFTPTLTAALEALYPRLMNAADWAKTHMPEKNLLSAPPGSRSAAVVQATQDGGDAQMEQLPIISKYILIAAYLASTNTARSDLRMFGRGLDQKKRKRRAVGAKKSRGGPAKVSRRLLGPTPFPLDRLIAILGIILEEYDADIRPPAPEFTIPGEYTEMEISRIHIYGAVTELASVRLLNRISPPEKLEGPPMFKCNISYDVALSLSRQLDVPLNDLMWDPA